MGRGPLQWANFSDISPSGPDTTVCCRIFVIGPGAVPLWSEYFPNVSAGEHLQAPDRFLDYVMSKVIINLHTRLEYKMFSMLASSNASVGVRAPFASVT